MDALGPTLVSFIADDDAPGARETAAVVKLFLRKVTAGRAEATQTDLLNYVLQKAFGHKPGLETNPELYAERNSDVLLSEG